MMTSFFAEFVHTDSGVACSERGFTDLSTAEECSGSVDYAKSFKSNANYRYSFSDNRTLKGCFIDTYGRIYFNTHSTGGRCSSCTNICRKGNA